MARSDIQAGKAYVELYVKKSQFYKSLDNARKRLNSFGSSVMAVGASVSGVGAGIVSSMAAAGAAFASAGDKLDKMSARTGVSAERLSALKFAAEQSGASIDDVGQAVQKMNRRLGRITAGAGSASQVDAMKELGLSVEEIDAMNPEQRFMALADAMKAYGDDAAAAGLAQRAFGTGVDKLLPLFANGSDGIRDLMEEAERLGITLTDEDTKAASALTDALNRMKSTMTAVVQQIGAAVAPVMEELANRIAKVTSRVIKFVKENRGLIVSVMKVGAIVAGVGTAIMAIGSAFVAAGGAIGILMGAMTGIASAFSLVGSLVSVIATTFGLLLSPIGLVVAALVAAGAAFHRFSDTAKGVVGAMVERVGAMMGRMRDRFGAIVDNLRETFTAAFQGIRDAVMAGDLALAGEIAMTALRVAVTQGMTTIEAAFHDGIAAIADAWDGFLPGLVEAFAGAMAAVGNVWRDTQNSIAKGILDLWSYLPGTVTNEISRFAAMSPDQRKTEEDRLSDLLERLETSLANSDPSNNYVAHANLKLQTEQTRRSLMRLRASETGDPIAEAQAEMDRANEAAKASAEEYWSGIGESARSFADESRERAAEERASGDQEIDRLRDELAQLQARSRAQREAAESAPDEVTMEEGDGEESGQRERGSASVATFSAHAAMAMAQQGGGPQERLMQRQNRISERQLEKIDAQLAKTDELIVAVENMGLRTV